jgi:hypothetical protein
LECFYERPEAGTALFQPRGGGVTFLLKKQSPIFPHGWHSDVVAKARVDLAYELSPAGTIVARFVALGLDQIATDEDNETTGVHMSEGDATIDGLIGTREFKKDRAALFFTQQHGETICLKSFRATERE